MNVSLWLLYSEMLFVCSLKWHIIKKEKYNYAVSVVVIWIIFCWYKFFADIAIFYMLLLNLVLPQVAASSDVTRYVWKSLMQVENILNSTDFQNKQEILICETRKEILSSIFNYSPITTFTPHTDRSGDDYHVSWHPASGGQPILEQIWKML